MSSPIRAVPVAALAFAALLAACGGGDSGRAPPVAAAARPPEPYIREAAGEDLAVSVRIPAVARALPDVGDRLVAEAEAEVADVARRAAERRRENLALFRPSEIWIEWTVAYDGPGALSLLAETFVDEGGANPHETRASVLYDRDLGREAGFADLFADPRPSGAAMIAVSEAAFAAWAEVSPSGGRNLALIDERTLVDVREALRPRASSFASFALTPDARDSDRVAAVTLLFPEGALGPRSDGELRLDIPAAVLAPHLAPAWAARFVEAPGAEQ
jgi:hypothetical protein